MNESIIVAFDVDGCLIHTIGPKEDTPRYDVISIFNHFKRLGCRMVVFSGGGCDYAKRWMEKLGLECEIWSKEIVPGRSLPDIVFDDEDVKLGKVNIKI